MGRAGGGRRLSRGGKQTCQSAAGQYTSVATEPSVIWGTLESPRTDGGVQGWRGGGVRGWAEEWSLRGGRSDGFNRLKMMKFQRSELRVGDDGGVPSLSIIS